LRSFERLSGESTGVPGGRHRRCRGSTSAHRAHRHCLADAAAGHHRPGRHPSADPGYGNAIPAPLIRANVGDELAVTVANRLNHPTSVHWHGIALRNDMDGVQPATPNINAGADFLCRRRHNRSYADVRIMPMRPQECLLMKRFTLEMSA
jgi:hypothetical protein